MGRMCLGTDLLLSALPARLDTATGRFVYILFHLALFVKWRVVVMLNKNSGEPTTGFGTCLNVVS
jgi:hypothetical protein